MRKEKSIYRINNFLRLIIREKMNKYQNPKLEKTVYRKKINNKIGLFNYQQPSGIIIIDKRVLAIINLCNGKETVDSISNKLKIKKDLLISFLNKLNEYHIISFSNKIKEEKSKILNCWLHITNNCNLNCRYCYITKNKNDLDFLTSKKIVDTLLTTANKNNFDQILITFSGGEPLLKLSLIKQIITYTTKQKTIKINYRILTNGTLINNEIINLIKKYNIDIRISLDGIKKYNDRNRYYHNKQGSYNDVIKNIIFLKDNGINPTINVVITKQNIDGLNKITKKLIELNLPFKYSLEKSNNNIKPETLLIKNKIGRKLKKSLTMIKKVYKKQKFNANFAVDNLSFNNNTNQNCAIGRNTIAINENGEIALCAMSFNQTVDNIQNTKDIIEKTKNNPISQFKITKLNDCQNCLWAKVCNNGCPILNMNLNNNLYQKNCYCSIYQKIIPLLYEIEAIRTSIKK